MICKHSIESEDGCKLCWKERAERAEACCAEMRYQLEQIARAHQISRGPRYLCYCTTCNASKAILSRLEESNCGQGWLSPDKAKLLVKALERIIEIRPYERCNDVGHVARQALAAAAKGEQQ